eukprot:03141_5
MKNMSLFYSTLYKRIKAPMCLMYALLRRRSMPKSFLLFLRLYSGSYRTQKKLCERKPLLYCISSTSLLRCFPFFSTNSRDCSATKTQAALPSASFLMLHRTMPKSSNSSPVLLPYSKSSSSCLKSTTITAFLLLGFKLSCSEYWDYWGVDDQSASEGMYDVLFDVLRKSEEGASSHYAIVYEAVRTISSIYPNVPLLEAAARCVTRFITSENHNLKYMGITALATLVQVNPKFATVHQGIVIDSLEDPDETLKRKTLDLLFKMTNPANVTFVVSRLIKYLRSTIDVYLRTELVSRITQLAERYAP